MDDTTKKHHLSLLHQRVSTCTACGLAARRTKAVFGEGALSAPLMIVGEAPGKDEDRAGRPFIGRAGKLLERMLAEIGVPRHRVWITNAVACWPPPDQPGKWQGKPTAEHVETCREHVRAQMKIVGPRVVVCMGAVAAASMLPDLDFRHIRMGELLDKQRRGLLRSSVHENVRVVYHPSYLLRSGQTEGGEILDVTRGVVEILRDAWSTATASAPS